MPKKQGGTDDMSTWNPILRRMREELGEVLPWPTTRKLAAAIPGLATAILHVGKRVGELAKKRRKFWSAFYSVTGFPGTQSQE